MRSQRSGRQPRPSGRSCKTGVVASMVAKSSPVRPTTIDDRELRPDDGGALAPEKSNASSFMSLFESRHISVSIVRLSVRPADGFAVAGQSFNLHVQEL